MADNTDVGSSRLLGTNNAQRAVDSLEAQVNKLAQSVAAAAASFQSMAKSNNSSGARNSSANWNMQSNFPTNNNGGSGNGGGTRFSTGSQTGGRGNGGGSTFAGIGGMLGANRGNGGHGGAGGGNPALGRFAVGGAVVAGVAKGLINYGNKNMSTNMQMDMFGNYSAVAGGLGPGGYQATNNAAMRTTFANNGIALGATDAAKGGYIGAYTFGSAQFGGQANQSYVQGTRQASGFGYSSPTLGSAGAMTAAQQTYTGRSLMMSQAMGLASPILSGGKQNSMGNIASSMVSQTFQGRTSVSNKELDAALRQGGSLSNNLGFYAKQMGWNQSTTQEYENYIRGSNAASNKGISRSQYDKLTQTAATGKGKDKSSAISTLTKATGMGASMFETQRNLNSSRLTRQEDILESLAPAFEDATKMVNKFSDALTSFLKNTGLDKAVGTGAGWGSAISGGLSGAASGVGMFGGMMGAARMFGGLGGLFGGAGGAAGGAASGAGGLINGVRGAGGAYNITSMGAGAGAGASGVGVIGASGITAGVLAAGWGLSKIAKTDATGKPTKGQGPLSWAKDTFSWTGIKNTFNVKKMFERNADRSSNNDGQSGGAGGGTATGSGSTKATGTNSGATAAEVIGLAEQQLGKPYIWGGVGPKGFDCSGLTQWAFGKAGVKLPRVASAQQKTGKPVATDKTQPGDLLFNGNPAHHVVMAIGGGKIIEAPHTGANVRIRKFSPGEFTNARRILGSVGNMGDLANGDDTQDPNTLNNQQNTVGGDIGGGVGGTSELEALMGALSGGGSSSGGSLGLSSQTSTSDSASTSSAGSPKAPSTNDKGALQKYAKQLLAQHGWSSQWESFNALEMSEAGWNVKATNPSSGAYGLAQALPASKYSSAGSDWKTNGATQLRWMMDYIGDRYKSPEKAWSFHKSHNWYATGAWNIDQDQAAQIHKGEMILPAKQAESVRSAITNTLTTGSANAGGSGQIVFQNGSIVVQASGSMTRQEAATTGKMIVDAITEDNRIKQLQKGK